MGHFYRSVNDVDDETVSKYVREDNDLDKCVSINH